jgi:hypothetical protein
LITKSPAPRSQSVETSTRLWLIAAVALLPLAVLLWAVMSRTDGQFTYTLDDPYIHLALARNIWNGHYGINSVEPSAPSSSILWPFLLAPFAAAPTLFEYGPLLINIASTVALAIAVDRILTVVRAPLRALLTLAILFSMNAFGLVFNGMEHSVQVLLVAVAVLGLSKVAESGGNSGTLLTVTALSLLPLIRYEGLAISLPAAVYLYVRGRRRAALIVVAVLSTTICAFSLFLLSRGLGYLPTSVVAKAAPGDLSLRIASVRDNIRAYGYLGLPIAAMAVYLWRRDRAYGLMLVASTLLQFTFGKYGWFGRYEVYFVALVVLSAVQAVAAERPRWLPAFLLLPFAFPSLAVTTLVTPLAASNILYQQGQMAAISQVLGAPIAVNDVGMMSLRSGAYVLDLWGLASIDALHARLASHNGAGWFSRLMEKHSVEYAFIYDEAFPNRPAEWVKVGELTLTEPLITPAAAVVSFYATSAEAQQRLARVLADFARTHPSTHFRVDVLAPFQSVRLGTMSPNFDRAG